MNRTESLHDSLAKLKIFTHNPSIPTYKYVDVKTALKIIRNGNLLFQSPKNFNDPLDPHLSFVDLMKNGTSHIDAYKDMLTEKKLKEFIDDAEKTYDDLKRKNVNKMGILCLSKTFKSTLMWSHYADKHKGVCLGFKNLADNTDGNINAFVVKYAENVTPMEYIFEPSSDDNVIALLNMFCTKAESWGYENEIRVTNYLKPGLYPFDKSSLCEVYFGVNTPQSDVSTVGNAIKGRGYKLDKIGKMKTDKTRFELEPEYFSL